MPRWPWRRNTETKKKTERKATLGLSESLGSFLVFGEGSAASPSSALTLYEKSSAVMIPINIVADAFAVINPVLMIGDEMESNHPVLDLLRNPSPWFTQELLFEAMAKNYLITGESPIVALGNVNRPPIEIQPLSPKTMTPVHEQMSDAPTSWSVSGNTLTGMYTGTPDGREIRYLEGNLRELKVIRNYSTRDNSLLRGQSLLLAASKQARQDILGGQHNVSLLERGGRVSLVFHFEEDMNEDDFLATKRRVHEAYGGATQAGEIAVTAGEKLNIKEAGITPRDMDFGAMITRAQKAVALTYRIPLPLISDERQTLNNYREGKIALYDDAVIPLSRRVFGGLGDFLLPRYGLDPTKTRIAFNPDDVSALVSRRNDELLKRKTLAIETANELRALIGREPIDEGGDVLYQPANQVPIGTDFFTLDNNPSIREDEATGSARDDEGE